MPQNATVQPNVAGDNRAAGQANRNTSVADARSAAQTTQSATQNGDQEIGQDARTTSRATATPTASQFDDRNVIAQSSTLGDNRPGDQAAANAAAGASDSTAKTTQDADQVGRGDQAIDQRATTESSAQTVATADQSGFEFAPDNLVTQANQEGDNRAGNQTKVMRPAASETPM